MTLTEMLADERHAWKELRELDRIRARRAPRAPERSAAPVPKFRCRACTDDTCAFCVISNQVIRACTRR